VNEAVERFLFADFWLFHLMRGEKPWEYEFNPDTYVPIVFFETYKMVMEEENAKKGVKSEATKTHRSL